MSSLINTIFDFLAVAFDKVPVLSKFKNYRSIIGLVGLAIVQVLINQGVGSKEIMDALQVGLLAWTGLALNAKGRSV